MTSPLGRAGRLVRTVSHLRARQLVHLGLRLGGGALSAPPSGPAFIGDRARPVLAALAALGPVAGANAARTYAAAWKTGIVLALGLEVPWEDDWTIAGPSPLWRYHLHYHDHLADLGWLAGRANDGAAATALERALMGWQKTWGAGGSPAWDAYPVSVRLVNWMRILAFDTGQLAGGTRELLSHGIGQHAVHLARNLEWHLDGNHLLRDACALEIAGTVLDGSTGPNDLFARTLAEQVGADGWHEERSPMYHARALRDAMEAEATAQASGHALDERTRARIDSMCAALSWMLRGDGTLWALNDTAQDTGVALETLLAGIATPNGVRHFDDARVSVLVDAGSGDRLRIDRGAPAPSHQPAHAHAGALGFEWDVASVPCIVDPGCSGYDGDPWRAYLRGTAAHSTVQVGAHDQSEMWATFRVGGRAIVTTRDRTSDAAAFRLGGDVRGWATRDTMHARDFRRDGRQVSIADRVSGARGRAVAAHLHLAPEWRVERAGDRMLALMHGRARARCTIEGEVDVSLHRGEDAPARGWVARGFNDVIPATTIRIVPHSTQSDTSWRVVLEPA